MKKPLITEYSDDENASEFIRMNTVINQLDIKEIIDVGLAGLKGKLETISGQKTECHIFLRNLYIMNSQSISRYKHIISNPSLPKDEDVARHYSEIR